MLEMTASPPLPAAEPTDAELVALSRAGHREAFGQIVARYQSLICALAYSAAGNVAQSEDLAQETFVAAWRHLPELQEPEKLRAWLCIIVRNRTADWRRAQGREPTQAADPLALAETHAAPEPSPSAQAMQRDEEAIMWRALEQVPELYREPLVLYYRQYQSVEHVAVALDISEDAVKQRLARGRKLL
jgi:RNA polymerase sigma factor (sigma-70 family)